MAESQTKRARRDEIRATVTREAERQGKALKELSLGMGRAQDYLNKFVRLGVPLELRESDARALEDLLGLAPGFLSVEQRSSMAAAAPVPGSTAVPEIDVRAGAGLGGEAPLVSMGGQLVERVKDNWHFPDSYLRDLRGRPSSIRILEIIGDSMEPMLFDGDRVVFDVSQRSPSPPGVFVIWDGLGLVCKSVEYVMDSDPPKIRITSVNSRYSAYERDLEEARIVGRLVARITRL